MIFTPRRRIAYEDRWYHRGRTYQSSYWGIPDRIVSEWIAEGLARGEMVWDATEVRECLELATNHIDDDFSVETDGDRYPFGITTSSVDKPHGFPSTGHGTLLTIRSRDQGRLTQKFFDSGREGEEGWFRHWHEGAWTDFQQITTDIHPDRLDDYETQIQQNTMAIEDHTSVITLNSSGIADHVDRLDAQDKALGGHDERITQNQTDLLLNAADIDQLMDRMDHVDDKQVILDPFDIDPNFTTETLGAAYPLGYTVMIVDNTMGFSPGILATIKISDEVSAQTLYVEGTSSVFVRTSPSGVWTPFRQTKEESDHPNPDQKGLKEKMESAPIK